MKIDLVIEMGPKRGHGAIEIKRSMAHGLGKGNHQALVDLSPPCSFYVHGGSDRFPMNKHVEAIGLAEVMDELSALE